MCAFGVQMCCNYEYKPRWTQLGGGGIRIGQQSYSECGLTDNVKAVSGYLMEGRIMMSY